MNEDGPIGELVSLLQAWAAEHVGLLVVALGALLLLQSLRLALLRGKAARRLERHKRLGDDGERRARSLLKKEGYKICAEQEGGAYELVVDGAAVPVRLRADYVVTRRGRRYVAEVKSGAESVKVTGRATRRQLLEYLFAFEVDGVVLVDMHERSVKTIEFPPLKSR